MHKLRAEVDNEPWVEELDILYSMSPKDREFLSIQKIVEGFFAACKENKDHEANLKSLDALAPRIQKLSIEKIEYYQKSWFNFIISFFSSLNNLILNRRFINTGKLGVEYTVDFISRRQAAAAKIAEEQRKDDESLHEDESLDLQQLFQEAPDDEIVDAGAVNRTAIPDQMNVLIPSKEEGESLSQVEKSIPVSKPPAPLNAKDKMFNTIENIWQIADNQERKEIRKIWEAMMKSAVVLEWKVIDEKMQKYQLKLKKEMIGAHSEFPFGVKLVIKKDVQISFSEFVRNDGQVIHEISNEGICLRIGFGIFSTDSNMDTITIQQINNSIICTTKAMKFDINLSSSEAVEAFNRVTWS